jgi:uncharacterized protein YoxC
MLLNVMVSVSLMFLALTLVMLAGAAVPLMFQAGRTLTAYERLAETIDVEIKPTLLEVKDAIQGINQIRSITTQRVNEVSHRVEDVADTVGTAAGQAAKRSSVWGAGLLAGVQAYFNREQETRQIEAKQYPSARSETNG